MALQVPEHVRLPQFAFPGDDSSDPSDLAETTEMRPRPKGASSALALVRPAAKKVPPPVPAAATQEIDAIDVLEVEPIEHHPSSVAPVAIDIPAPPPAVAAPAVAAPAVAAPQAPETRELADLLEAVPETRQAASSEDVRIQRHASLGRHPQTPGSLAGRVQSRGLGWGLGIAIVGVGCLLVAIVNAAGGGAHADRSIGVVERAPVETTRAAAAQTPGASAPAAEGEPAPETGVPVVSVLNLPKVEATTGTVRLIEAAAAHRLWVDGVLQPGTSAVVPCGKRMIKVGSSGHAHAMIIGCGEETVIAR